MVINFSNHYNVTFDPGLMGTKGVRVTLRPPHPSPLRQKRVERGLKEHRLESLGH